MAQQRALTILPDDPGSMPSTHVAGSQLSVTPHPGDLTLSHKHTCTQNTNAHKINKPLKKKRAEPWSSLASQSSQTEEIMEVEWRAAENTCCPPLTTTNAFAPT